jgi:hypothetical protein
MTTDTPGATGRRPSRRVLQRELWALAAPDARDRAFAHRLDGLLEQTYVRLPPFVNGSSGPTALPDDLPAQPAQRPLRWTRRRGYLGALVALMLAASGGLAYVELWSPSPVSAAQALLHRAAAAASHLTAGRAVHLVYRFYGVPSGTGHVSGTIDIWMRANARGAPVLVAETQTTAPSAGAAPIVDRRVLHGRTGQEYLSGDNIIRTVAVGADGPDLFISGARYFSAFAVGQGMRVRLLPARTLDGVRVAAVQIDPPYAPGYTVYFDTRSYLLRGMDIGDSGRGRLVTAATIPAAAVPPGTFSLNAPPTARRSSTVVDVGDMPSVDHPALALVSICNTPPAELSAAMSSGSKSPLDICRSTDPGITKATLIAALAAEEKARLGLDEGVAAGKLTAAQEAEQLAALHGKLAIWVSRPLTD